jgi:hypothetical protein
LSVKYCDLSSQKPFQGQKNTTYYKFIIDCIQCFINQLYALSVEESDLLHMYVKGELMKGELIFSNLFDISS